MARWWGPRGFTNPGCELAPWAGGAIRIDMRGPDGTVYPMTGEFVEVVEPERIIMTNRAHEDESGKAGLGVVNTATFAELGGRTELTVRALVVHATPAVAGALAGMEQGWSESLDRLGELLAESWDH
jgi:uncharacterized protein YndB with AHSA1/START domain